MLFKHNDHSVDDENQSVEDENQMRDELKRLRRKEGITSKILMGLIGLIVLAAVVGWVNRDNLASADYVGQNQFSDSGYTGVALNSGSAAAAGAGGCCGGGATATTNLGDLEKQALAQYKQEPGAVQKVTAKATNYGCHVQIDILDANKQIVRSYADRGGSLTVIR